MGFLVGRVEVLHQPIENEENQEIQRNRRRVSLQGDYWEGNESAGFRRAF